MSFLLLLLLLPFYSLLFAFFPAYDFPVPCLRLLVQKLWPNSFQALYYRCRYFIYEVKVRRPSLGRMDECQFVPVELIFSTVGSQLCNCANLSSFPIDTSWFPTVQGFEPDFIPYSSIFTPVGPQFYKVQFWVRSLCTLAGSQLYEVWNLSSFLCTPFGSPQFFKDFKGSNLSSFSIFTPVWFYLLSEIIILLWKFDFYIKSFSVETFLFSIKVTGGISLVGLDLTGAFVFNAYSEAIPTPAMNIIKWF